jgi:hypothetical protein
VQAALAIAVVLLAGAVRADGIAGNDAKHLGVATCASSTCHGRVSPAEDGPLPLNEYFIWSKYDPHSRAYRTLEGVWSRRIAANMGLESAAAAPECLACHTGDVPPQRRGERFQVSDGIGCETCHGGAENWIGSHYDPGVTHTANLRDGMQPSEEPVFQARLCQSCHLGDTGKLATHEMMAAGHPRLRFELDTWLANMPPHHVVDADYRRRKDEAAGADRWAAGVAVAAGRYLEMLSQHLDADTLVPELALFDCHACHRLMDSGITRSPADKRLTPAGSVRPNDHALRMLAVIVAVRDEILAHAISAGNRALHGAASASAKTFRERLRSLREPVARAGEMVNHAPLSTGERAQLRTALLRETADGHFRDYADAEFLFLGLQSLTAQEASGTVERYDALFGLLDGERSFDPRRVADEARRLLDRSSQVRR